MGWDSWAQWFHRPRSPASWPISGPNQPIGRRFSRSSPCSSTAASTVGRIHVSVEDARLAEPEKLARATGPGISTESERDGGDAPITIRLRAELPIRRRSPCVATAPAAVDLAEPVVAPLRRALEPPATSGPTTGDWVQGRGAGPWTSFGPPPPSNPSSTGWPEGADSAVGSVTRRLLDAQPDETSATEVQAGRPIATPTRRTGATT